MSVIPTRSSIFLSCLLVRFCRPHGMVTSSSSEDSQSPKSIRLTTCPPPPSSTRSLRPPSLMPAIHLLSAPQLSAHTWAASRCRTWGRTRGGCACATAQCTTSSGACARAPPSPTCPGSTTRCTAPSSASRRCSTPTSPASSCTSEPPTDHLQPHLPLDG